MFQNGNSILNSISDLKPSDGTPWFSDNFSKIWRQDPQKSQTLLNLKADYKLSL